MDQNRTPVTINGVTFYVLSGEKEAYVQMLASKVNQKIDEALEKNRQLTKSQALTLAAFNLADECYQRRSQDGEGEPLDSSQEKDWVALVEASKDQIEDLKEIIRKKDEELKEKAIEIQQMEDDLKKLEKLHDLEEKLEQLTTLNNEQLGKYHQLRKEHTHLKERYKKELKNKDEE